MQDLIVYLIVAGATVYLGRYAWNSFAGKKGCGCGTNGCGPKKAAPQNQVIQISLDNLNKSSKK